MDVQQTIEERLRSQLQIERLEVLNESHKHAGHSSSPRTGQSHFSAVIVSSDFEGLNKVARHRRVYQILSAEMAGPIHALALTTLTPGEASAP